MEPERAEYTRGEDPLVRLSHGDESLGESTRVSKQPDYGSLSSDSRRPEEAFNSVLIQWGGARVLLIQTWANLMPVILPLVVITFENLDSGRYVCRCGKYFPEWTAGRVLCVTTSSCMMMFPSICRLGAIFLVTWRFVRQRCFYVLLKHKVIVDLEQSNYLARRVMQSSLILFILSMIHIGIVLANGRQDIKVDGEMIKGGPLLANTFWELMDDPSLLFRKENRKVLKYISECLIKVIVPAIVAMLFLHDIDDAESTLIPFSKFYEGTSPQYAHEHVSRCVRMPESVAREILEQDELGNNESEIVRVSTNSALKVTSQTLSEACATLREEAVKFDSVCWIGQPDMEKPHEPPGSTFCLRQVTLPPVGLLYVVTKTWWPLELILKVDESDALQKFVQFRTAFCIHCIGCGILIVGDLVLRMQIVRVGTLWWYNRQLGAENKEHWASSDMIWTGNILGAVLIFGYCRILYRLGCTIRDCLF